MNQSQVEKALIYLTLWPTDVTKLKEHHAVLAAMDINLDDQMVAFKRHFTGYMNETIMNHIVGNW